MSGAVQEDPSPAAYCTGRAEMWVGAAALSSWPGLFGRKSVRGSLGANTRAHEFSWVACFPFFYTKS